MEVEVEVAVIMVVVAELGDIFMDQVMVVQVVVVLDI